MKDELRSESQAEMGGEEKSGKAHFSARLGFLPSPSMSVHESPCQSNPVKLSQTGSLGQAGGPNPCKPLSMNNLRNKQLSPSQTMLNLVNMVKMSQSASDSGCPSSFPSAFSLSPLTLCCE
jgi:hypothetical protein